MLRKSFFAMAALWTLSVSGQTLLKGKVIDGEDQTEVTGASVYLDGSSGTTTDVGGSFSFTSDLKGEQTLKISFVGYETLTKKVNLSGGTVNLGNLVLGTSQVLKDVEILADFVESSRATPIAVSTISSQDIELKLGSQEFPEVLKSTPGVYTTKSGGGFGDSRIVVRGFSQEYVAVMVNGIPVNDMENGAVYWSNWSGLSDYTKAQQVQRGLGASKLAINSVGGTINTITRTTDAQQGGAVSSSVGSYGTFKTKFLYNTGELKGGWFLTMGAGFSKGDGYVPGTQYEGYSYFGSLTKTFGKNHILTFMATGAPQSHGQRNIRGTDASYAKYGNYYNPEYAQGKNVAENQFHKPHISVNYTWNVKDNITWQTSLYASIARGYGQGTLIDTSDNRLSKLSKSEKTNFINITNRGLVNKPYAGADGTLDWSLIQSYNSGTTPQLWADLFNGKISPNDVDANGEYQSLMVLRGSYNEHNWYGGISTVRYEPIKQVVISGGLDARTYQGDHYRKVLDLLGGDYYLDKKDKNDTQKKVRVGDKVDYYNTTFVNWLGAFGQVEYKNDYISTFVNGSVSNKSYKRKDYFNYKNDDPKQTTPWKHYLGYNVKAGFGYNINKNHNVFVNGGYYNNAPFVNTIFANNNNEVNKSVKNEKVYAAELGYGMKYKIFAANVNAYYTRWNDRAFKVNLLNNLGYAVIPGMAQEHYGVELDFEIKPVHFMRINGMFSLGDWQYKSYVKDATFVDENDPSKQTIVNLDLRNVKVPDAAQLTAALSVRFDIWKGLFVAVDGLFTDFHYAGFNQAGRFLTVDPNKPVDPTKPLPAVNNSQSWRMPRYYTLDAQIGWNIALKGANKLTLLANVNNFTNNLYISDGTSGNNNDRATSSYYYGSPIMWTGTVKFSF